jgi:hypothetical protein
MRNTVSALALVVSLMLASPASAQDLASSIVGLWKLTSHGNKVAATGAMTHPFGEHPAGYQLFTRGGRLMFMMFGENRKRPGGSSLSDPERVALFNGLVSYSGTYKVEGSKILMHFDAEATPAGVDRTYSAELSGNKLTLTAQPFLNTNTGQQIISIRTFERAE